MANIGKFSKTEDGYTGEIHTYAINTRARILPADQRGNDAAPDWRVHANGAEIGAAWTKEGKDSGKPYLSVKLDDPSFPAEIRASLFQTDTPDEWELVWTR